MATAAPTLPRTLVSALRREGLKVKEQRNRGHVALKIWVGTPGTAVGAPEPHSAIWPEPAAPVPTVACFDTASLTPRTMLDHHLRHHVVMALTRTVSQSVTDPLMWLARTGTPDLTPADVHWFAAATQCWASVGLTPDFAVVTREGWHHVRSGTTRRWKRLRG